MGADLVGVNGGFLNISGPLLQVSGASTVTIGGDVLNIASTVTGPSSGSLFLMEAGSLSATSGDLVDLASGSTLSLSGPLLTVSGGSVAVVNALNLGASLTTPTGQPLLQVTSGSLNASSLWLPWGQTSSLGVRFSHRVGVLLALEQMLWRWGPILSPAAVPLSLI